MDEALTPARRIENRTPTHRPAVCVVNRETWLGTVHDESPEGAFFQPTRCVTSGEIIDAEDAWMVAQEKDVITLRYADTDKADTRKIRRGTVRWSGCSDIHRVGGLGLKFQAA